MDQLTVYLQGVGGQSIPLIVEMLARHADRAGWRVTTRQTFGMAQRQGVVGATVRLSRRTGSVEPNRSTPVLIAFDRLEGLRGFNHLVPGARAYVSRAGVAPPGQLRSSGPPYPSAEDLEWAADHYGIQLTLVDANFHKPWQVVQAALDDGVIPPPPGKKEQKQ